ncbi:jg3674, partial [Pararge aegeria aegeria]
MILCGSKDDEYKTENFKKSYDETGVRLFKVEGTKLGVDMRAIQMQETADSLEEDDIFILETPSAVYVWSGKESSEQEQEAAKTAVTSLVGDDKEVIEINQGEEPEEFWEVLGGQPEENVEPSGWKFNANRRVTTPLSLTAVSVRPSGKIKYEELPPGFTQK